MTFNVGLDLFPLLAGVLAAVTCGLLGNFLVLRRLSLMGDAISHSVLPGLVVAFLITSTRAPMVMFAGAAVAGVATVVLVELVKRLGRVEPGAAMGVVFSVLFALGVLLIEQAAARHVDLDADCVLHGQLETLVWYGAPESIGGLWSRDTLDAVPRQVWTLAAMCAAALVFVVVLFKELRLAAFDPGLSTAQGFNAALLHVLLMVFVAGATVASFEAVGSILVIAMLVCPAATARLVTDRLAGQIVWSVVFALVSGVGGYLAATAVPGAFGRDSVSAAGSMAVVAGGVLMLAALASPTHGVVARRVRRVALARSVVREDLLALLWRAEEAGESSMADKTLRERLGHGVVRAIAGAARDGLVQRAGGSVALTEIGRGAAVRLIRRHRLWERYLVDEAGVAPDHVHETAEQLEHFAVEPGGSGARTRGGGSAPADPGTDPHGRPIP